MKKNLDVMKLGPQELESYCIHLANLYVEATDAFKRLHPEAYAQYRRKVTNAVSKKVEKSY